MAFPIASTGVAHREPEFLAIRWYDWFDDLFVYHDLSHLFLMASSVSSCSLDTSATNVRLTIIGDSPREFLTKMAISPSLVIKQLSGVL